MLEPQEIEDEEYEQVLERVAAIDVAKATGMVCTRVPHPSRPGKRRTTVREVAAATGAVLEVAEQLAGGESSWSRWRRRRTTGGSGSTCWRRPGCACSW